MNTATLLTANGGAAAGITIIMFSFGAASWRIIKSIVFFLGS
jgi:hypothetical protein